MYKYTDLVLNCRPRSIFDSKFYRVSALETSPVEKLALMKVIVRTVVVQFIFKVSQYRKYMQTNIRIHFNNNELTKTHLLVMFLYEN